MSSRLEDIIQRQKAEIETLQAELKFYKDNYLSLAREWQELPCKTKVGNNSEIHSKSAEDYDNLISDIKAEAVKEFAELILNTNQPTAKYISINKVKNLAKEMTEGKDNA